MMNSLEKVVKPQLENKVDKTPEDMEMLEMMINGKDCVKKENLNAIIKWLNECKQYYRGRNKRIIKQILPNSV